MSFTLRAKRVLVGAMAGAMVLSLMPAGMASAGTEEVCANAPDSGFPDKGTTHGANIDCMAAYDVFQGRVDGTFGTFANITRGAAATFFVNFAVAATDGALVVPEGDVPFTDMGNVFDEEISILYRLGLVDGTSETTFSPAANITRGQFAKILYEAHVALGVPFADEYDEAFPDQGDTFGDEIAALAGEGIISGFADGTYRPFSFITRGAAASLLAESAGVLDDLGIWAAPRLPDPVAPIGPNETFTNAPELVSVEKGSAGIVRYNYDAPIPGQAADLDSFRIYNPAGAFATPSEVSISGSTVIARYGTADTPNVTAVSQAVRAGARTDAVAGETGLSSLAGDFPLTATAQQVAALIPDLVSVGNYRFDIDARIDLTTQHVLVDFTFNDPTRFVETELDEADVAALFAMYGANGQEFIGDGAQVAATHDAATGLTTVTVPFGESQVLVPQAQLRRGTFTLDVINYLGGAAGNEIIWSANFGATNGTTVDPDLVSIEREGNTNVFQFRFDEGIDENVIDDNGFVLVNEDYETLVSTTAVRSVTPGTGAAVIRAQFSTADLTALGIPVKGFVVDRAVLATDSTDSDNDGFNRPAAANITIPTIADPTPGVTALPDLVSAERIQNVVTGRYSVAFTFNASLGATAGDILANAALVDWNLYDDAGTEFTINPTGLTAGLNVFVSNQNRTVTILSSTSTITGSGVTDDQIEATVTATVQTSDDSAAVVTEGQQDARSLTTN